MSKYPDPTNMVFADPLCSLKVRLHCPNMSSCPMGETCAKGYIKSYSVSPGLYVDFSYVSKPIMPETKIQIQHPIFKESLILLSPSPAILNDPTFQKELAQQKLELQKNTFKNKFQEEYLPGSYADVTPLIKYKLEDISITIATDNYDAGEKYRLDFYCDGKRYVVVVPLSTCELKMSNSIDFKKYLASKFSYAIAKELTNVLMSKIENQL